MRTIKHFFNFLFSKQVTVKKKVELLVKKIHYSISTEQERIEFDEEDVFHAGFTFEQLERLTSAGSQAEYEELVSHVAGTQLENTFYNVKKSDLQNLEDEFNNYKKNIENEKE
ncbi:MAG: hypothetical protein RSF01_08995 [Bacteroidales bacterium]